MAINRLRQLSRWHSQHEEDKHEGGRVILLVAEVIIQLTLQRALDHHLGQLPEQPALAGQLQPARAGALDQLAQQLLIGSREPAPSWCRQPPLVASALT